MGIALQEGGVALRYGVHVLVGQKELFRTSPKAYVDVWIYLTRFQAFLKLRHELVTLSPFGRQ